MPKKSNSTVGDDDADLMPPKLARDEIQSDEPTKSQLKKMAAGTSVNVNVTTAPPAQIGRAHV